MHTSINREFENHTYIIFGKCFCRKYVVERLPDGTALDHDNVPDGWYLLFNFPFTKDRKYLSMDTFEMEEGKCQLRLLTRIRKFGTNKFYSVKVNFTWLPLTEHMDLPYNDPYLSALKIIKD